MDLADFEGNSAYAEFENFKVDSASAKYKRTPLEHTVEQQVISF